MDYSIFKTYDIRGVYPEQFNEDLAYKLGRAYATWLKAKESDPAAGAKVSMLKVGLGSDMRLSSPALKAQVLAGLLDSGINVEDIGLVSTPSFYFAVASGGYDGGIQVSASHNPKQYNGLKIVTKNAVPVSEKSGLLEIRQIVEDQSYCAIAPVRGILSSHPGVIAEEAEQELSGLDLGAVKPFKIVIDAGNGMGSLDMAALFSKLPQCEIIKMNFELDGNFPAHEADPMKAENTADLCARVIAEKADLGIAPDGDADRIFFIDDKGKVVPQEILRGILAQIELRANPRAIVTYDLRPGQITKDMIAEVGGRAIITPVGHSLIKEIMISAGAVFGAESSGHYFYKMPFGTFEAPMLMIVKFLLYLSGQTLPLSEVVAPLKRYFSSGEINLHLESHEAAAQKIELVKEKYPDGKQSFIDGISVEYPDYWFLVRASNTEPLIRFTVEARSREVMEKVSQELRKLLQG